VIAFADQSDDPEVGEYRHGLRGGVLKHHGASISGNPGTRMVEDRQAGYRQPTGMPHTQ
jgi:hypothetical protein